MDSTKRIVRAFMRSHEYDEASVEATVSALTADMERAEDRADAEGRMWTIISTISEKIRDIPYSSPKHDGLVSLLKALKAAGRLEGDKFVTWSGVIWSDLPMLGMCMREEWNCCPEDTTPGQWANRNAFAAKLTVSDVTNFDLYCIWCFRPALEEADEPNEYGLAAVMVWLKYAGPSMVDWVQEGRDYSRGGDHGDPAALGQLAKDAGLEGRGFYMQRWRFWRRRLRVISRAKHGATISKRAAGLATRCLQRMESLEKLFDSPDR